VAPFNLAHPVGLCNVRGLPANFYRTTQTFFSCRFQFSWLQLQHFYEMLQIKSYHIYSSHTQYTQAKYTCVIVYTKLLDST